MRVDVPRTVAETIPTKEEAMQRMIAPAIILWLAAFGAAQAQTSTSQMPGTTTTGTATGTTAPGSSASVTGPNVANQPTSGGTSLNDTPCSSTSQPAGGTGTGCGSDPLNVPARTIPTTVPIPQPGSASSDGSTVGMSASPSVNPQRATQLPGEGSNTSTQTANTSASSAPAASGSQPCPSSVPTSEGGANMTGVFGGASGGSC